MRAVTRKPKQSDNATTGERFFRGRPHPVRPTDVSLRRRLFLLVGSAIEVVGHGRGRTPGANLHAVGNGGISPHRIP